MSREIRRAPVGWKHPVEHNPHWEWQQSTPYGRSKPPSRLHGPTERFVPLYGKSYTPAHEQWERETPETYMPDFGVPEPELGWCLYETVSEGTPVTPIFATVEELIEHLCTVGQDHDQVPMRRAAVESIVRHGGTAGSLVSVSGKVYRSDTDADLIDAAFAHPAAGSATAGGDGTVTP